VLLSDLSRTVGPELSRSISEWLQERRGRGSGEEAMDCLQTLRRTALEAKLRALQKEIVRCERNGEKEKLAALLSQKQAMTKKIMSI
jgi:RNase P/RNase MRP subunit POP5